MINHLDLFSGIGGFALGLESTGHFRTVGFCEIEDFPRRVLAKHWPNVRIDDDVNNYRWLSLSRSLGRRETPGIDSKKKRGHICPDWLIIENTGHRWRAWVPELRRELHKRGYASLPIQVRADWFGFPHRRARVFLVANTDSIKLRELSWWWQRESGEMAAQLAKPEDYAPRRLGADDGLPDWAHRRRALGNAVVPQIVASIGRAIAQNEY